MATGPRYRVAFRRRREGRTDYHRRLRLISGHLPRLVVRRSLYHVSAQVVEAKPQGDTTLVQANSRELAALDYQGGNSNTTAAYLVGLQVGKRALAAGVNKAVLDIGLASATRGSVIFAALKGAVDAGLEVPHDPEVFPSVERIRGKHASRPVGDIDSIVSKLGGPKLPEASEAPKKKAKEASKGKDAKAAAKGGKTPQAKQQGKAPGKAPGKGGAGAKKTSEKAQKKGKQEDNV